MVFVIAECGVNWRNLSEADDMIREAAAAGADAVKFQCYRPHFMTAEAFEYQKAVLMSTNAPHFDDWLRGAKVHPEAEILNRIALTEPDVRYLYWRCQQHGVEFLCTPMFPEAVDMLNPYVKRWKVRCADSKNDTLLDKIRKTGKPALISTEDWCPEGETILADEILMRCVPEYPPGAVLCDKGAARAYSCHIPWIQDPLSWAKCTNLEYLEVHVRLDKYDPAWCPIDQRVSITMSELRELCKELGK